jgi:peroxiredoxin
MRLFIAFSIMLSVFSAQAAQSTETYKKSIDEKIEKMKKKKSSWTDAEIKLMKDESDQLAKALPNPGIQVGEKAPSFSLTNSQGKKVTLESELAKGPVVLVFYRGAWCPYCNMQLRALKKNLPAFKKHNAQLVTITPQTPDKSEAQFKKEGYPFEVLSDLNNKVMKDYKLYFEPSSELVAVYKKHGLDLEGFNGDGRTGLPVPGTFVIDQSGIVRAMKAQTDYKIRMEPADIIKALEAL